MLQTAHAASKACLSPSLLSVFGHSRIVTSFLTLPHSHRHEEWRVVSQHKVQTKLRGGQTFSLLLMWQWGQPHLLSVRHPETEVVTVPLTRTSQDSVLRTLLWPLSPRIYLSYVSVQKNSVVFTDVFLTMGLIDYFLPSPPPSNCSELERARFQSSDS